MFTGKLQLGIIPKHKELARRLAGVKVKSEITTGEVVKWSNQYDLHSEMSLSQSNRIRKVYGRI